MFTEKLETRLQFSAAASVGADTLYVYCDQAGSDIKVELSDDHLSQVVKVRTSSSTYSQIYSAPVSSFHKVRVYGRGGSDRIDLSKAVGTEVVITGGHGSDYIITGGFDCIAFGDEQPSINAAPDDNASDTIVDASSGDSAIYGQGGNDFLYSGMNSIKQGMYNELDMSGGAGNDVLDARIGQAGRNVKAYGNSGNDTFRTLGMRFMDFLGGDGTDTADLSSATDAVKIDFSGQRTSGKRYNANGFNLLLGSDVENGTGGVFGDELDGNDAKNVLRGGGGFDDIYGGGGNDTLYGDDGYDNLYGEAGNDTLHGGNGNDLLIGAEGQDSLYGEAGNDEYYIVDGYIDYVFGGTGDHLGAGKDAQDIVYGF